MTFFLSLFNHIIPSPITDWDVSLITDMSDLFKNQSTCNPDIASWDVSAVTTFVSITTNL